MIVAKSRESIQKMAQAGALLAEIFEGITPLLEPGVATLDLDTWLERALEDKGLVSQSKGYMGYEHVSCISVNDEVVHGVPSEEKILQDGDVVKIDVCASWQGYCADMARTFFVGDVPEHKRSFAAIAEKALAAGVANARAGKRLSDISAAVQKEVERHGYGVVRDFAGHGIGQSMHEEPEVLNYGEPGCGPLLRPGMALAIEPMITMGHHGVHVTEDGWTVKTDDGSIAAHAEDTVVITEGEPLLLTRVPHGVS